MSDPSARLLSLLSLLQTPREWPGSELATRLGVSARTVRRDIERLRDLGYPVEATMGAEGGYRLVAGAAMPPLLLDDGEAVAIAVGLRIASGHAVEGIDEASVRALAKLERVLPSRLRHRVSALGAATVPLLTGYGPAVDPATLTALATAIAARERLRFTYHAPAPHPTHAARPTGAAACPTPSPHPAPDAHAAPRRRPAPDGEATRRLGEPHHLVAAGRRWYLLAFDLDRADWRVFRVDRIAEVSPTGVRFAPRELPAPDPAEYVARRLYSLAPTYRAVATLHAPADDILRAWGTSIGEVTPLDDHTCHVVSHADTLEWLAFRLTLPGCDFEVHDPPELAAYLHNLATRALRATAKR
ncbi:WYL domain-containing protein [Streptosporangiaceae bacterium NEAU-GS5]|nr:WYL domain-containing protein [Streptosporangiaceae bacterium NEAU-GS5]